MVAVDDGRVLRLVVSTLLEILVVDMEIVVMLTRKDGVSTLLEILAIL